MSNNKRKPVGIPKKVELRQIAKPATIGQQTYWNNIEQSTITIAKGPAGSGKDYIAVYLGLKYLLEGVYKKFVITRPIVECGEKLGSLPGSEMEKVHPYLRPVLDIILEFMHPDQLDALIEKGIIDVCPIAYSRGLTFNDSFCLLSEAQNCSMKQLKMFLTRIGKNAKMVIQGDVDQSDLLDKTNALQVCFDKLKNIDEVGIVELTEDDIMRNPLIRTILKRLK